MNWLTVNAHTMCAICAHLLSHVGHGHFGAF
jgi:hypothetical protein